jgi:branched-chain amino acid transport system substrate-binding protein
MTGLAGCGGGGENVVVGSPVPLSGPLAALGEEERRALNVAVDYVNEELDGMAGRTVEVVFEDTETDPATGRDVARRLVEQENADVLCGCVSGAVTNSVADYAYQASVPFWPYGGSESTTGSNCAPTTFRYVYSTSQDARAGAPWAVENLGSNVWIHYADYSYGQSINQQWRREIENHEMDTTIVDTTSTSLGTSDYSSYLSQIQSSDADWVLMGVTGSDLIAMIQQANQFGLKDEKALVSQNLTIPIRGALGSDVVGVYGNIRYTHKATREANQTFVDRYMEEHDQMPSEPAMVMWTSLLLHAQGAEDAGSVATEDIVPSLSGIQSDTPMGETTIRECDHQASRPYPMGRMTEPEDFDFPSYEILSTRPAEEVIEPCEESGCDMPSL